ncbi:SAM-dependent methyltransferase [Denitratisoma oestradiolicum]|uniref:Uncharacterized protein n=1 Tax=Denitratisoma oestradiolicum TaxID=311182 RepID=A0A6S6XWS4_9PROT|nr:methyltransferase domain-containing protein [Denitratisoma oestradiolicum]TWO80948.1 hypothetical protein CBW56_07295 [Denitratisoma oestradiolicum]CAB1367279.1 conserved protein of unknown function [Denitratisoma oestradiolicum]
MRQFIRQWTQGKAQEATIAEAPATVPVVELPGFANPVCQLVNTNQFLEPEFKRWACQELGWQFGFNRKLWEYAFILNAIDRYGRLDGRGLGFGVGREPIIPVMLRHGARLLVTDLSHEDAQRQGWATSEFDASIRDQLDFRFVNMNEIPADLRDFDFLWSCGSLEHIGSLEAGLAFIESSLDCLKPGGVAVHTTEFNFSSQEETRDAADICFYRDRDIESLVERVRRKGGEMTVNLARGDGPLDKHVDYPPYVYELSMRAWYEPYAITSVGLVIHKR